MTAPLTLQPTRPGWSTQARIESALMAAKNAKHNAWKMGPRSIYTGCQHYEVFSNTERRTYFVTECPTMRFGGYRYLPGQPYLSCSCAAWTEGKKPCSHCGRVALRLQREAKASRRAEQPEGALPVVCPRCDHENLPGAIYCEVCGHNCAEASLSA